MKIKLLYLLPLAFSECLGSALQENLSITELNRLCIEAAKKGSTAYLVDLIKKGADPKSRENGLPVLHLAAALGHSGCVKALIEAKAGIYDLSTGGSNGGETALHWAALRGHHECVQALIAARALIDTKDKYGVSPLLGAAFKGHLACIKLLIDAKADVNTHDDRHSTPLLKVAEAGHAHCVKILLQANADATALDELGNSAFSLATMHKHLETVKALLENSYLLVPAEQEVAQSRNRIYNILLFFISLRKQHPEVENLKSASLHFEILSKEEQFQDDLAIILLDELKKGRELKDVLLIRAKDSAVRYLLKKVKKIIPRGSLLPLMAADMRALFTDRLEELVKKGLDERIEELKTSRFSAIKPEKVNVS